MTSGRARTRVARTMLAASFGAGASAFGAATSGTWISTYASTSWATAAQWIGAVPDGGGAATFTENLAIPQQGQNFASPSILSAFALSQLNFDSASPYYLSGSASGSIALAAAGGTLNVTRSTASSWTTAALGDVLAVQLTGGALTKAGAGNAVLAFSGNTYTGGTTILGGMLTASQGDGSLGTTSGGIRITNAAFGTTLTAFSTSRTVGISGTAIFRPFVTTTFAGPVSGTGTILKPLLSGGVLSFNASNSFSGAIQSLNGTFQLAASGSFNAVTSLEIAGQLNIDDSATNNADRLSNSASLLSHGAELRLTNTTSGTSVETIGSLTTDSGMTLITIANGTSGTSTAAGFAMTSLTRSNRSTLYVRGNSFGGTASTAATVTTATSPGTLFGGGLSGTPATSILPWAVATTNGATSGLSTAVTFMTYESGKLRPLDLTTEYASAFSILTPTSNVRIPAGTVTSSLTGGTTVNALSLSGNATLNGASDGVTVTAGGVISFGPGTNAINTPLVFPGGAEGVFNVFTTLNQGRPISGTGGLTKSGGSVLFIAGAGTLSTYTGQTTVVGGTLEVAGNLPADGTTASALGRATSAIVLSAGSFAGQDSRLLFATNSVVSRGISVTGTGSDVVSLGSATGTESVTFNGAIKIDRTLTLSFGASPAAVSNGVISGIGGVTDANGSAQIFNGSNIFSGGVSIAAGAFYAGNDTAFGTGTIISTGAFNGSDGTPFLWGTLGATGTGSRTLSNPIQLSNALTLDAQIPLALTGTFDLNGYVRTVAATGTTTTLSGPIINGGLVKLGSGTLVITGSSNTYNSGTTVVEGVLQIGNGGTTGALGTTTGAQVLDGATISVKRSNNVEYGTGAFAGPGTFSQDGTGITFIVGSNGITGTVAVNNGNLVIGSGSTTGTIGTPAAYVLRSPGLLTFWHSDDLTLSASISGTGNFQNVGTGMVTLAGSLSYTGTTTVDGGGKLNVSVPLRPVTGGLTVTNGSTAALSAPAATSHTIVGEFGAIDVSAGTVSLTSANRPTLTSTLLIANTLNLHPGTSATGRLQLLNNDLLVHATPEATIVSDLTAGLITSSGTTAAHTGLAVITNANGRGGTFYSTFDGIAATATDVLVKYTYVGDTDLNGVVDGSDLANLFAGLRGGLHGYVNGDLNYDGVVNSTDLSLLLGSLSGQGTPLGDSTTGGGAVPEPASGIALLAMIYPMLSRRRARGASPRRERPLTPAVPRPPT